MIASILTLVVAVVGFIVTLVLNAFVLDKYDAYGEVPIPGSSQPASACRVRRRSASTPMSIGSPTAADFRSRSWG